jgi:hypothetical protein
MVVKGRKKSIRHLVDEAGGVREFEMREVRDEFGFARLGPGVGEAIIRRLGDDGLGTLSGEGPYFLPVSQDERVFVFAVASPFGRVVEAILNPTSAGIQKVLELAAGDANAVLDRIRDLLGGDERRSISTRGRRPGPGRE